MNRPTVLFMDDDVIFRTEIANHLLQGGYDVTCCGTASEAKEQLQNGKFDLVISDIFVKSDGEFVADGGVSLLGWMQTRFKIPTIAITGLVDHAGGGFLQNMRELGADVCLSKPLDHNALRRQIAMLLAKVDAQP